MDTRERLENSIKLQPDRWLAVRERESKRLLKAWDKDTGRLWLEAGEGWIWID